MTLPIETAFGGVSAADRDVTVILVPKGGSRDEKLAVLYLHSHVLSTHSRYFNTCLSERWKRQATSMEFALEVQTEVQHYLDCFSNMYSPFAKKFRGVKCSLELLKVASQIDFEKLMERISLYLSSMLWTKEEEIRIRHYAASPDFPRIHLNDLVARLGLDAQSEEDRQRQLSDLIGECTHAALKALVERGVELPALLQSIGSDPPSDYSRMVISTVSQEAKRMFASFANEWSGHLPSPSRQITIRKIGSMIWILETLLQEQVAEELLEAVVHFDAIPKYIADPPEFANTQAFGDCRRKLAELVLVMYQDVAAGHLLLRPPERFALLKNWHALMKKWVASCSQTQLDTATANLFMTLPVKQQTEFIKLRQERVEDYIRPVSLMSLYADSTLQLKLATS